MVEHTCYACGGDTRGKRTEPVEAWWYDAMFRPEAVCLGCWQKILVNGTIKVMKLEEPYILRPARERTATA